MNARALLDNVELDLDAATDEFPVEIGGELTYSMPLIVGIRGRPVHDAMRRCVSK